MIGGPNPSISDLARIYIENSEAISQSLTRIASGKRVQVPSDDFAGYIRAASLETDVESYLQTKQDIQEAKGLSDYAAQVGNSLTADFDRLLELQELYQHAVADGDALKQAEYTAEYNATVARIHDVKDDAYFNGVQIYRAGVALETVSVNPENGALTVVIQATAIGDEDAISNIANVAASDIQNELINAETYTAQMESFSTELQQQLNLADTAINSKRATISAITDINEIEEMSTLTALQLRQQAAIAMLAQSNAVQGYTAKLYANLTSGT